MSDSKFREYLILATLRQGDATCSEIVEHCQGYISYPHCKQLLNQMTGTQVRVVGSRHTAGPPATVYQCTQQGKRVLKRHHTQLVSIITKQEDK